MIFWMSFSHGSAFETAMMPEDLLAALKRGLDVALVVLRLDVDGALLGVDAEIAAFRHATVDVRHQLIFEAAGGSGP